MKVLGQPEMIQWLWRSQKSCSYTLAHVGNLIPSHLAQKWWAQSKALQTDKNDTTADKSENLELT